MQRACLVAGWQQHRIQLILQMRNFCIGNRNSSQMGNAANGLGVTLGGSDLLDLTVRIRVGSHNLSHST